MAEDKQDKTEYEVWLSIIKDSFAKQGYQKCQSTTYGTIAYIFYGNMNAQTDISKKSETSWRLNPTIILPTPRYKHKFIMFHLLTRWTLMIYSK